MENRNWREVKLGDIIDIISKKTPIENATLENYISTENMINDFGGVQNAEKLPTTNTVNAFVENDILFSNIRTYFKKVWHAKFDGTVSQDVLTFRAKENIISKFLYYILCNPEFTEYTVLTSKGAKMPRGDKDAIRNFEIQLPQLPEQKAIASVLSSLDDKIDLLHQQNQTLEALAETLFRQWFINYSENQNEPKKETEIGNVPESFKVVQIKDLDFVLETGKRPKGGVGTLTSGVPSIGAENIKGLGMYDHSKTKYISQEFADKMNRGHIKGYELLIYKDGGTPGHFIPRYSIFGNGFPFDTMTINEHVFKLDFNDKAFNFFCYFYFQTDLVDSILVANGAKAAIPGINQDDVKNLWIIHPETPIIKKFGDLTLPYLEKILFNCNQIQTLTQLRDTLLPKLMSGEVRVKV